MYKILKGTNKYMVKKKKSPSYPSPSLLVSTPEAPSGSLFICLLLEVAHALQVFSLKIIVIK